MLFMALGFRANAIGFSYHLNALDTLPISIVIVSDNVKCFGQNNGSASTLVSGGIEPYTYLWSNNYKTPGISNLSAGIYLVTVNDAIGQIQIDSVTISEPEKLVVSVNDFVFTCNTKPQTIYTTVTGGEKPYIYKWSTGQTTPDILADGKDLYKVSVTDANGCKSTAMVYFIKNQNSPYINIDSVWTFNCNTPLVLIKATVDPNVNVHWSPEGNITSGQNTLNPFVNKPGVYIITAIDTTNDCMNSAIVNVYGVLPLTANVLTENIACNGDTTGSALINLSGGEKPYTYTNSCCDSVINLNNLNAGFYSIIIKDNTSCIDTVQFEITQPAILSAQLTLVDLSTPNANNGKAYCYPEGGTAPYQVSWSNGQLGDSIDSLHAGKYEFTVTDSNGCTYVQWFYINDHQCNMIINYSGTQPINCAGGLGSFCADVKGGVLPYNYVWTNNENSSCLINVASDKYGVTVTDASGCKAIKLIDFTQPVEISILSGKYYIQTESGYGFSDASINFVPNGGSPPYTIEFDNGLNGHLPAGKNIATITDSKGCTNQFSFIIPEFNCKKLGVHIAEFNTNTVCANQLDSITIFWVMGGIPPYSYTWPDGSTKESYVAYPDTSLLLKITDTQNCTTAFHPYSFVASEIKAQLKVKDSTPGNNNGSIQINEITGGIPPYHISWMNGSNNLLLDNLSAGIYCVSISDVNGCQYVFCNEVKLGTSTSDLFNNNWSLYPNPSRDLLYLKSVDNTSKAVSWVLLDNNGQILKESTELNSKDIIRIPIDKLVSGTYFIQVKEPGFNYLAKFQKE